MFWQQVRVFAEVLQCLNDCLMSIDYKKGQRCIELLTIRPVGMV